MLARGLELARSFGLGLNNDDWLCSFLKLDASIIMMHRIGLHAAALGCEDGAELPKHVFAVLVAAALTLVGTTLAYCLYHPDMCSRCRARA